MGDFLIDGCWVLRTYSGVCLVEEIYTDFKKEGISRDLITGFLSAIVAFADEAFKDELQSIKFANHKILLRLTKSVIFVVAFSILNTKLSGELRKSVKAEINEVVEEAWSAYSGGYYEDAMSKAREAIDFCRYAISQPALPRTKENLDEKLYKYLSWTSLALIIIAILYYSYHRMRIKKV